RKLEKTDIKKKVTEDDKKKKKKTFKIYCKLHHITHFGDMVRKHGPLRHYANWAMERKHQFPKGVARASKNFMNPAWTIVHRHQAMRALQGTSVICVDNNLENQQVPNISANFP